METYDAFIESAAEHFKALLQEQLLRQQRMESAAPAKDFAAMEKIVIGVIGGDGIGPIIVTQARRVLEKLLAEELAVPELSITKCGGESRYLESSLFGSKAGE